MLQIIFNPGFARGHQHRLRVWHGRIDKVAFAGLVVMGADHDIAPALHGPHAHKEARVRFFIDTNVLCRVFPQPMAEHFAGAVVLINPHIKEGGIVERPGCTAACVWDSVCKVPPGLDVPDLESEIFRAFNIAAPGEQSIIGTARRAAYLKVTLAFSFPVPIKDDGLTSVAFAGLSAKEGMLSAGLIF